MKKTTFVLIFILTLGSIELTNAQRNRKLSPRTSTAEKVNVDIQNKLSLMFEAKEFQNLISNSSTIRFKAFEDINERNFKNFKIKGKVLEILDPTNSEYQNNPNYFYITAWEDVLNMLNVEIVHQETKSKIKILLTQDNSKWEFGTSELISEKKVEDKRPSSGRKPLKRRG